MSEPRAIARCTYCKQPVLAGQSFLCLMRTDKNAYIFLHCRPEDELHDCSEMYPRRNGASVPIFEELEDIT
jgi:hypothetical protein